MKHANISIFVPHMGCPHKCAFCNQHVITGGEKAPSPEDVFAACKRAAETLPEPSNAEIAFFGGSFTAIERGYMLSLLEEAYKQVKHYGFKGIRVSTRPDAINNGILSVLKKYSVTAVELGAQSMVDSVLNANLRGHTSEHVRNAARLIKNAGFELGLQMMTGLYKDTKEGAVYTAKELAKLHPDTVRIYPAVILKNTHLDELYKQGKYTPPILSETIDLCAVLLEFFYKKNIPVIRLGLHKIDESEFVAGGWHPSLRELCESRIYFKIVLQKLKSLAPGGEFFIYTNPKEMSKMNGNKKENIEKLRDMGYNCIVKPDEKLGIYEVVCKSATY